MCAMLTIVSCGLSVADLSDRHRQAIAAADVLAGGQRLLSWFADFTGLTVVVGANATVTVIELVSYAQAGRQVVVLASGDALFFGIARLFCAQLPPEQLRILPNITAAQAAMSRLHQPYNDALFFTLHGRDCPLPWRQVLRAPLAVIYADARRTPARLAQDLIAAVPEAAARPAAILMDLGSASEDVHRAELAQLAQLQTTASLSMLVLLPDSGISATPTLPLGLDDAAYQHERGLITHAEIRAVVLAKLRLRRGVMWDLGAGSGSVAVEAAGLVPTLTVHAVEQKPQRCRDIEENVRRHGCGNVKIHTGDIRTLLPQLPDPDAVFIGGGGRAIGEILETAFDRLRPGGCIVVAAVLAETQALLTQTMVAQRSEIVELAVRRARCIGPGSIMQPDNPIMLFTYTKSSC